MIKKVKRTGFAVMDEVDDLDILGGQQTNQPPTTVVPTPTDEERERLRRLALPV